jgi:hypothetical protein
MARRWTTHLKTEVSWAVSGEGRQAVARAITLPGQTAPVPYYVDQRTRVRSATATTAWQFFDNQWVHPFVEAGVAIDWQTSRTRDPGFVFYTDPRSPVRIPGLDDRTHKQVALRALLGAGAKLYVTEQLFVRLDTRGVFATRLEHLSFRGGLGFDF